MNKRWAIIKKKVLTFCICGAMVVTAIPQMTMANILPMQEVAQVAQWDAGATYVKGDKAIYNGITFEAKWWTTNEEPDANNQWGVWQKVEGDISIPEPEPKPEQPSNDAVKMDITSDWGSGFNYNLVIKNTANTVLKDWVLSFDYSGELTSAWDVKMAKQGNHYTFTPMSWRKDIPSNGTISFGGGGKNVGTLSNIELSGGKVTPEPTPNPIPDPIPDPVPVNPEEALTDAQINALWGGIDSQFSPQNAVNKTEAILSKEDFEILFPMRHGSKGWNEYNNQNISEYYTYEGLKDAVYQVANVKYKIETRGDAAWNTRVWRLDKTTKKQILIAECADFNAEWNLSKPINLQIVDFGTFLSEGSAIDRKRELAAFLANIAHETGGGWATAPGGELAWGLYFNEEVGYSSSSVGGYVDGSNKEYPPVAGKSYHGRGPIQISWNYNYGLMSAILYGDKTMLLQNPEKVVQDPTLGYMTAMSFWMTPQGKKPSCHDVMANKWIPTEAQIKAGCTTPCFGVTINVINGGYEAGKGVDDYRIRRRSGHYKDITSKMGIDITGEKLDTLGMSPL